MQSFVTYMGFIEETDSRQKCAKKGQEAMKYILTG